MKVLINYQVLNDDDTAFGTIIVSGPQPDKATASAVIQAVLESRQANATSSLAKHNEALSDFTG